jgi:hypothetical protein
LDVVSWQTAIIKGLKEESHGLEEVGVWVNKGVFKRVLIQKSNNLGEEFELVLSRLSSIPTLVICFGRISHATAHILDFGISHLLEILFQMLINCTVVCG